jgi:hypothetical protein
MEDLIKALQIFFKYGNPVNPTHCEHDELTVMIDPDDVSDEDKLVLKELGFRETDNYTFCSTRFGSA